MFYISGTILVGGLYVSLAGCTGVNVLPVSVGRYYEFLLDCKGGNRSSLGDCQYGMA